MASSPKIAKSCNSELQKINAVTEVQDEFYTFSWTVKNFNSLIRNGDNFNSPIFEVGFKTRYKWQISLFSRNNNPMQGDPDYVSVSLMLKDWLEDNERISGRTLRAKFEMSLYGSLNGIFLDNGKLSDTDHRIRTSSNQYFFIFSKDEKIASFVSANAEYSIRTELFHKKFVLFSKLNEIGREGGAIKINCKLWIRGKLNQRFIYKNSLPMPKYKRILRRNHKLSSDLLELLKTGLHSDFTIKVDESEFKVHKAFLAARSPVFQKMFEVDMKESNSSILEIFDFDKDVVQGTLEYIYTGETKLLEQKIIELLRISEKYELVELKEQCEENLARNLTLDNACQTLLIADMHNAVYLKSEVIDYINMNKEDVSSTNSFKELIKTKPHVFADLYLAEIAYSQNNIKVHVVEEEPQPNSIVVRASSPDICTRTRLIINHQSIGGGGSGT